jgi:hypothetical protein
MDLMGHEAHARPRPRARLLCAAIACLALAVLTVTSLEAGEADAAPKVTVLGAAAPATPGCPKDPCEAIARTTGFQTAIGRATSPFRVPYPGRIVAWSIKLGKPVGADLEFFEDEFGQSQGRLAVLKPIMKQIKKGNPIYKLKHQSPVEVLKPFFGQTTTFTLQRPLNVKRNQVVALTIPTWAPALARINSNRMTWMASRKRTRCGTTNDGPTNLAQIKAGKAQQGVGKDRAYACNYRGARVLYSATLVKRPGG